MNEREREPSGDDRPVLRGLGPIVVVFTGGDPMRPDVVPAAAPRRLRRSPPTPDCTLRSRWTSPSIWSSATSTPSRPRRWPRPPRPAQPSSVIRWPRTRPISSSRSIAPSSWRRRASSWSVGTVVGSTTSSPMPWCWRPSDTPASRCRRTWATVRCTSSATPSTYAATVGDPLTLLAGPRAGSRRRDQRPPLSATRRDAPSRFDAWGQQRIRLRARIGAAWAAASCSPSHPRFPIDSPEVHKS